MDANAERNEIHRELTDAGIRHAGIGIDEDRITVSLFDTCGIENVQTIFEFLGFVPGEAFRAVRSGRWTISADKVVLA